MGALTYSERIAEEGRKEGKRGEKQEVVASHLWPFFPTLFLNVFPATKDHDFFI